MLTAWQAPAMSEKRSRGRPRREPQTPLELWFAETGTSYEDVAARFGLTPGHIKHVARGIERPSRLLAAALELLTGGAVTAKQLLGDDDSSNPLP